MCSRAHVMLQLERLLRVYPRPAYAPADSVQFAADYAGICAGLTDVQFTSAVDTALRGTGRFFPKPGELLAVAGPAGRQDDGSLAGQYRAWLAAGFKRHADAQAFAPCPVCGAEASWTLVRREPEIRRLLVLHDATAHRRADVPFTGWAQAGPDAGHYAFQVAEDRPHERGKAPISFRADLGTAS